jgi:hypothetical protein
MMKITCKLGMHCLYFALLTCGCHHVQLSTPKECPVPQAVVRIDSHSDFSSNSASAMIFVYSNGRIEYRQDLSPKLIGKHWMEIAEVDQMLKEIARSGFWSLTQRALDEYLRGCGCVGEDLTTKTSAKMKCGLQGVRNCVTKLLMNRNPCRKTIVYAR